MRYLYKGYRHQGFIWIITRQYPKKDSVIIEIRRYVGKTPITIEVVLDPSNLIEEDR